MPQKFSGIRVTSDGDKEAQVLIPKGEETLLRPSFVLVQIFRPATSEELAAYGQGKMPPVSLEKVVDGDRRLTALKMSFEGAEALRPALNGVLEPFQTNRKNIFKYAVQRLREHFGKAVDQYLSVQHIEK